MSGNPRRTNTHRRKRRTLAVLVLMVVALVIAVVGVVVSSFDVDRTAATTPVAAATSRSTPSSTVPTTVSPTAAALVSTTGSTERAIAESATLPSSLPPGAVKIHAPILMYHYVDDTPPPAGPYADGLTVRTNDFRAEMEYLVENGFSTVSLADIYLAMAGQESLPAKPVVLTFDDGGLDNYEVAFPILNEYGLTGTFFVITRTVGREGQMTWEQLREMAAQGMSIQSHTVSHPDLRAVSASKLRSELVDSRQAIAEAIGEASYVLCYPSGAYDNRVIAAARTAGYVMAVATDKGKEGDPAAVYEMKRRRIQAFLPLETFARLVQ